MIPGNLFLRMVSSLLMDDRTLPTQPHDPEGDFCDVDGSDGDYGTEAPAWLRGQRLGAPLQKGQLFQQDEKLPRRYEIVSDGPIGQGAMGRVYRATDHALRREIAIKELIIAPEHPRFDELSERFRNEALVASRIAHPCIPAVYDQGYYEKRPWYAMEWLRGARSLADYLDEVAERGEPSPIDDGLFFLGQIASALRVAHELGLWHRDIKPANVLLAPLIGGGWIVKLIDWGIAHDPDARLTDLGTCLGTPAYMAPECFDADFSVFPARLPMVDHRSDLFSLGVTFYEYFTGQHPYPQILDPPSSQKKLRRHQIAAKIYQDPDTYPAPLGQRRPGLPDGVEAIIHRLIERRPEDRYQHTDEVLRDLAPGAHRLAVYQMPSRAERIRQSETVAARRPAKSPHPSPRPTVRWFIAAVALAALALLSFSAGRWMPAATQRSAVLSGTAPAPAENAEEPIATTPAKELPKEAVEPPTADKPSDASVPRKRSRKRPKSPAAETPPVEDPWPAFLIEKSDD